VKFGPVTPQLTELICERQVAYDTAKKLEILDRFSQYFLPYESTLRANDGSVPYFPNC